MIMFANFCDNRTATLGGISNFQMKTHILGSAKLGFQLKMGFYVGCS